MFLSLNYALLDSAETEQLNSCGNTFPREVAPLGLLVGLSFSIANLLILNSKPVVNGLIFR
jgi:hypothetical protein